MLLCPYCSFSNPETATHCLGCGNDLPHDPGLGASLAEFSKGGLNPPASEHSRDTSLSSRQNTGTFGGVDDSDVLGDMDAALDSFLKTDLGMTGQEDESMAVPPTVESLEDDAGPTRMVKTPPRRPREVTSSYRPGRRSLHPPESYTPSPVHSETEAQVPDLHSHELLSDAPRESTAISPIDPATWKEIVRKTQAMKQPKPFVSLTEEVPQVRLDASTKNAELPRPPIVHLPLGHTSSKTGEVPIKRPLHRPETTERLDLKALQEMIVDDDAEDALVLPPKPKKLEHTPATTERLESSNWADIALNRIAHSKAQQKAPTAVEKFDDLGIESIIDDVEDERTIAQGDRLAQIRDSVFNSWGNKSEIPTSSLHAQGLPTSDNFELIQEEEPFYPDTDSIDGHTLALAHADAAVILNEVENELDASIETPSGEHHTLGATPVPAEPKKERWFGAEQKSPESTPQYSEHASTILGGKPPIPFVRQQTTEPLPEVATQKTRLPFIDKQTSTTYLFIALDVETHSEQTLSTSKRMLALDSLKELLLEHIRQSSLFIEETEAERIVVRTEGHSKGVHQSILMAKQLLEEVNRFDPPSASRMRVRCVLSTVTSELKQPKERAFAIAARLLRGMPVDRIWLDWTTFCTLDSQKHCQEVLLPSLEEPAYEVAGVEDSAVLSDTRQFHAELSEAPQWIGRTKELHALQQQWNAVRAGEARQTLVLGGAGSGRSRLIETFCQRIAHEAFFFLGSSLSCPTEHHTSPYLAGLLLSHLQFHHMDRHQGLRQQVTSLATMQLDGQTDQERTAQLLFELAAAGSSDGGTATEEALKWYMCALTSQRPVVIVLDDLFLLERRTHRLLQTFLQNAHSRCLLILVSSEEEYEEVLFSSLAQAHRIELSPLTRDESRTLLNQLQLPNDVTHKQIDRIVDEAGGNPRLLCTLAEASKNVKQREPSHDLAIPSSAERLLLQKQQGLSHLEKDTLRKAAVIGDRFWKGAIECLERLELNDGSWSLQEGVAISHMDDRSGSLKQLLEKQLIQEVPHSNLPHESEYRFPHRILRRTLMQQLPSSIRQKMHKRVAQWLSLRDDAHVMSFEIAHHLKLAGDAEGAAWRLFEAAESILKEERFNHALSLLSEALELLGTRNPTLRIRLLDAAAHTYFAVGDIRAAMQLYEAGAQLSWRLTSPKWGAFAFIGQSRCFAIRAEFDKAQGCLLNAATLARQTRDTTLEVTAELHQVRLLLLQGDVAESEKRLQQKEPDWKTFPDSHPVLWAHILSVKGYLFRLKGLWRESILALQDATSLYRSAGQMAHYASSLVEQAEFYMTAGDEDSALPLLDEAIQLLRQKESFLLLQKALLYVATIALARRDTQRALSCLKEAWKQAQASGEKSSMAPIAAALAATFVLLRQPQDSLKYAKIAVELLKEGTPTLRATTYFFLGEASASMNAEQLKSVFQPAPPRLPEGGMPTFLFLKSVELFKQSREVARQISALLFLGRSLLIGGFTQTAINVLERGIADAERMGLGLLLERLRNQRRLLSNDEPMMDDVEDDHVGHSTLVVRKTGFKQGKKKPFASARPAPTSAPSPFSTAPAVHPQASYFQGKAAQNIRPNPYQAGAGRRHSSKKDG